MRSEIHNIRPAECYDKDPDPLYGHRDGCVKWLFGTLPAVLVWVGIVLLWMQPWRP